MKKIIYLDMDDVLCDFHLITAIMKTYFGIPFYAFLVLVSLSCGSEIKNKDASVTVEKGTAVEEIKNSAKEKEQEIIEQVEEPPSTAKFVKTDILGFWVGDFMNADEDSYGKNLFVDEGFQWNRDNKINISIDRIGDSLVFGHSVVAGNTRPFEGTIRTTPDGAFLFEVKEPGDDRYDGIFTFVISNEQLKGTWSAYKKIDIPERKYELTKKEFAYNPDIMLDQNDRFIDWSKRTETIKTYEDDGEEEEWIYKKFASATNKIYELNASNTRLSKSMVENLKKGDLLVIRNTIYARHGYSFKNRPLRVFFDDQSWYIPVHNDIRSDFTDLEKENIDLLLRYEENAITYYDRFGRG